MWIWPVFATDQTISEVPFRTHILRLQFYFLIYKLPLWVHIIEFKLWLHYLEDNIRRIDMALNSAYKRNLKKEKRKKWLNLKGNYIGQGSPEKQYIYIYTVIIIYIILYIHDIHYEEFAHVIIVHVIPWRLRSPMICHQQAGDPGIGIIWCKPEGLRPEEQRV